MSCPNCGDIALAHHVCSSCGVYKGKEVIEIPEEDTEEKEGVE